MSSTLTPAERLKFRLLAGGVQVSKRAMRALNELNGDRPLTPADYASTTGLILMLDDDVWVNAPIAEHNPNFVSSPSNVLDRPSDGFEVRGAGLASRARFWFPPAYHGERGPEGAPWNNFIFTHGDRARLAPIQGCAMTCKFCNIPYQDRYATKPLDALSAAVRRALDDPIQPARHLLISGGTPRAVDYKYLSAVYERILTEHRELQIDIMMVPAQGLLDLPRLRDLGLVGLSVNIEIFNGAIARDLMRQKHVMGIDYYLRFLEGAVATMGPGAVRSLLMVGLEPIDDTLEGVKRLVEIGCVPVLSPFRPDPSTPLRGVQPLEAEALEEVFLRSTDLARQFGLSLGPDCPPCTHNTLTLAPRQVDASPYHFPVPATV